MGKRRCRSPAPGGPPLKAPRRGDFGLYQKIWPVCIKEVDGAVYTVYSKSDDAM